ATARIEPGDVSDPAPSRDEGGPGLLPRRPERSDEPDPPHDDATALAVAHRSSLFRVAAGRSLERLQRGDLRRFEDTPATEKGERQPHQGKLDAGEPDVAQAADPAEVTIRYALLAAP